MKSRLEEALMKPSSSEGGTSKKRISETLCGLINKQIELIPKGNHFVRLNIKEIKTLFEYLKALGWLQ